MVCVHVYMVCGHNVFQCVCTIYMVCGQKLSKRKLKFLLNSTCMEMIFAANDRQIIKICESYQSISMCTTF